MTFVLYIKVLLLQFRSSLFSWKRGQQGQKLSRILCQGTRRHGQSTVKTCHGRRLNGFQVLEGTPCIASLKNNTYDRLALVVNKSEVFNQLFFNLWEACKDSEGISIAAKVGDKGQEVAKACPIENSYGIIV